MKTVVAFTPSVTESSDAKPGGSVTSSGRFARLLRLSAWRIRGGSEIQSRPRTRFSSPLLLTFIAFVAIPSFLCQIYLAFLASDQYAVEARFAVRSIESEVSTDKASSNSSSLRKSFGTTTISSVSQNAYIVLSYIRSRALVDDLSKALDLESFYRPPDADIWARLKSGATIEDKVRFLSGMVDGYVDALSGIVTLNVRAFKAEDAKAIADGILHASEKLVNDMSTRARRDAMSFGEEEIIRADKMVRLALDDMRRYRDSEGLIDPVKAADEKGKLLGQLVVEKVKYESDLFVANRSLNSDAPTVRNLRLRIESLDAQIATLRAQLTNTQGNAQNIAASLSEFERLEFQRQFAERVYSFAQDGMERARMAAERQSIYLTVFVRPALPEYAEYPQRFSYSIIIPIILIVLWSIGALIFASIEDHRI